MAKIKNDYQRELDQLKEQNLRLAENTKKIEERYREVAEMAKKAMKTEKPVKEAIITIEDEAETSQRRKKVRKPEYQSLAHDRWPQSRENETIKLDEGSSSKTLPKKPPSARKKPALAHQPSKQQPRTFEENEPSEEKRESKANTASGKDRSSPKARDEVPAKPRFLLPQRGKTELTRGDSFEKLQKDSSLSSEELVHRGSNVSSEDLRKKKLQRKAQKAAQKELLKRDEVKKNTLAEILKLKEEISEVTTTLKVDQCEPERRSRQEGARSCR
jgi:hypothetical protein